MAQDINISKDLYDLLVAKNFDPNVTDAQGQESTPDAGTVFKFDYVSSSGKNYGTAVIIITEDRELLLFFGDNLGKSMEDPEDKDEWFRFLQQLSKFATRHNFYTFTPKNLNQIKHTMAGMAAIKEGLFEGYYGTKKISYMGEATDARLVIKHNRLIGENDKRYRYVESLFIETADGERFKLPFTKLVGGRAMLEHVRQGGKPYDVRGVHIAETIQEMAVLARFNRANHGRIFEGATQELVEDALSYYHQLQENIKHMASSRGYHSYFESWSPADIGSEDALVEDIKTLFIEQTLDTRIEAALPTLAKIQQGKPMKEAEEFEAWANRLTEGTWALPETPEAKQKLSDLIANPLPVGPDAANATEQLYDILGDDELFDRLIDLANKDANADARPVIIARMREMGMAVPGTKSEPEVNEGDNLATFEDAVDDFIAQGGTVQRGKYHKPRKSEKTDYGSKHIGGVRDAVAGKAGKTLGRAAATNFMGGGKAVVGEGSCNHTMEGEMCPEHGLVECGTVAGAIAPLEEGLQPVYQAVIDDILDGELDAYDVLNHPQGDAQEYVAMILQDAYETVARDHRLHPDDDFEQILDIVVRNLENDYGHSADQGVAEGKEEMVGFHLDSERAYEAVMARFGHVIDHDEDSGTMYVPERLWPTVEAVAYDADGIGAQRDDDLENPEHYGVAEGFHNDSPVANAITRRIMSQRLDLLKKYGPGYVTQAIDDVADSLNIGPDDEIGSSDVSGWVRQVEWNLKNKLNQYDEPMNVGDTLDERADPMDSRSAVTDSFYESQIERLKKLALGK